MNGMNTKPSARKTHRKTRTGCRTCKSRKIKVIATHFLHALGPLEVQNPSGYSLHVTYTHSPPQPCSLLPTLIGLQRLVINISFVEGLLFKTSLSFILPSSPREYQEIWRYEFVLTDYVVR